jgi:uncharacterized membrane protein YgaE (UPF0421/DUF939 family)
LADDAVWAVCAVEETKSGSVDQGLGARSTPSGQEAIIARSTEDERWVARRLHAPLEALDGLRRRELLEAATARSRVSTRGAWARLRVNLWPLVQTSVAAALAWFLAAKLLGDPSPFFAPVAAIMSLGATRGERLRGALELILGVALGIGLGELLRRWIGVGEAQLALTVGLAMAAAVLLGAGRMLLTEAAVSASLVATVSLETQGFPPTRLLDALVGGAVALVFSQVLFPVNPVKVVCEAAESIIGELAETLRDVAGALEDRDLQSAERALVKARRTSEDWSRFEQALDMAREAARYAPTRRRQRESFGAYEDAGLPLDLMVRDVHVLARGAVRALMIGDRIPRELTTALRDLARSTAGLASRLGSDDDDAGVRSVALRAAYAATELAPSDENVSASVLVGYTQATAADVLRALGMDRERAHDEVGQAARAASG